MVDFLVKKRQLPDLIRWRHLDNNYVRLNEDYRMLAQGISAKVVHVKDAKPEAGVARLEATALAVELGQLRGAGTGSKAEMDGLRWELREFKADCESLEDTVLAITTAVVNGLVISQVGQMAGQPSEDVDARLAMHATAINGRLDFIRQEMKGGGITVGGVTFSGQEAAMDWAQIYLPPNT